MFLVGGTVQYDPSKVWKPREIELVYRVRYFPWNDEKLADVLGRSESTIKSARYSILQCRCRWSGLRLDKDEDCARSGKHAAVSGLLPMAAMMRQFFEKETGKKSPAGVDPPRFGEWSKIPPKAAEWVPKGPRLVVGSWWMPWDGETV